MLCSASTAVNKIHEALGQVLGTQTLADVGIAIDLGAVLLNVNGAVRIVVLSVAVLNSVATPEAVPWAEGAAPGGWTGYLAGRVQRVIAVDPADLDPAVLALPNVTHLRMKSEDAGVAILRSAEGLQQLPAPAGRPVTEQLPETLPPGAGLPQTGRPQRKPQRLFPPKPAAAVREPVVCSAAVAGLLVCDMNTHPESVCAAIVPLLPCLKSGAWIICTMKFFGRGRERSEAIARFQQDLGGAQVVTDCCCVWLLSNTVHERTFILRKV